MSKTFILLFAGLLLTTQVLSLGYKRNHYHIDEQISKYQSSHQFSEQADTPLEDTPVHDPHFDKIQKIFNFGGSFQIDSLYYVLGALNVKVNQAKVDSGNNRAYVNVTADITFDKTPLFGINAELVFNFTNETVTFWFGKGFADKPLCYYMTMSGNANLTQLVPQLQIPKEEGGLMEYVNETTELPDANKTQGNFSEFYMNFTAEGQLTQLISIFYDMENNGNMKYLKFNQPNGTQSLLTGVSITNGGFYEANFTDDDFKIQKLPSSGKGCQLWDIGN